MRTVEGVYRSGKVEFLELPEDVDEDSRVLVTFPEAEPLLARPDQAASREERRQAAFAQMAAGIPLGGPPYPRREELYDRSDR